MVFKRQTFASGYILNKDNIKELTNLDTRHTTLFKMMKLFQKQYLTTLGLGFISSASD